MEGFAIAEKKNLEKLTLTSCGTKVDQVLRLPAEPMTMFLYSVQ